MKLLYIPLGFLLVLALFSLLGLGSGTLGGLGVGGDPESTYYYDYGGHSVCTAGGNKTGEAGWIACMATGNAGWVNTTGVVATMYTLYWDQSHAAPVAWGDVGKTFPSSSLGNISLSTSMGFLALVVGLMLLATLVGIRILGNGISEESVSAIIKGTALIAIWGVFSVLALNMIANGLLMNVLYFVLTLIYTLGIVNQIGHPGAD